MNFSLKNQINTVYLIYLIIVGIAYYAVSSYKDWSTLNNGIAITYFIFSGIVLVANYFFSEKDKKLENFLAFVTFFLALFAFVILILLLSPYFTSLILNVDVINVSEIRFSDGYHFLFFFVSISSIISGIIIWLLNIGLKWIVKNITAFKTVNVNKVLTLIYRVSVIIFSTLSFVYSFSSLLYTNLPKLNPELFFYLLMFFQAYIHKEFIDIFDAFKIEKNIW